jgi:hypothetical protein
VAPGIRSNSGRGWRIPKFVVGGRGTALPHVLRNAVRADAFVIHRGPGGLPHQLDEAEGDETQGPVAGTGVDERKVQVVQQQKHPDTGYGEPGQENRRGNRV